MYKLSRRNIFLLVREIIYFKVVKLVVCWVKIFVVFIMYFNIKYIIKIWNMNIKGLRIIRGKVEMIKEFFYFLIILLKCLFVN